MTDTHTHIFLPEFDADRDEVVRRAAAAGIGTMILPNIDTTTIEALHRTVEAYPGLCHAAMGLHPSSVTDGYRPQLDAIRQLFGTHRYCAVGEIGIDLYWEQQYRQEQMDAFARQVAWAQELHLPVIIHCREALDEVLEVLQGFPHNSVRGVFHSFTGTPGEVEKIRATAGDFYFGINGIVTFKKVTLGDTLQAIGRDRILLETDAPYLAPVPHRGKRNEPAFTAFTAARVAQLMGTTTDDVAATTDANARTLFGL